MQDRPQPVQPVRLGTGQAAPAASTSNPTQKPARRPKRDDHVTARIRTHRVNDQPLHIVDRIPSRRPAHDPPISPAAYRQRRSSSK
jgi:hypothetical protein